MNIERIEEKLNFLLKNGNNQECPQGAKTKILLHRKPGKVIEKT